MATKRAQTIGLVAVLLVLVVVLWVQWRRPPAATAPEASNVQGPRSSGTAGQTGGAPEVGDVNLEALAAPRPEPGDHQRNPFRFERKEPPPLPPAPKPLSQPAMPVTPPVPTGPPPPPPITVKFIGILDAPTQTGRKAILSDKGAVDSGKEGEIVFGQYKIIKIGVESIEISYADGRGRTTIRLTG